MDASGNLFIADTSNNRIRKVSTSGVITTVAGNGAPGFSRDGGPATSASLSGPSGVAVDASGNVFIADTNNDQIRKVSTNGIITTVAGTGARGFSGDDGPAASASLASPVGVAVDASGNVFIADTNNYRVRKVAPSGIITTVAGSGTRGFGGDGGPATSAQFVFPVSVAVGASGGIFIADPASDRIRAVSTSGIITTFAGNGTAGFSGDGGSATSATLTGPAGVAVDAFGNLFIVDKTNNRIRKVSREVFNRAATSCHSGGMSTGRYHSNAEAVALRAEICVSGVICPLNAFTYAGGLRSRLAP